MAKAPKKSPEEPTEISEAEASVTLAPPAVEEQNPAPPAYEDQNPEPTKSPDEPTEVSEAEASIIPAPLAAAVEEQDSVMQAHAIRQANHFQDLAPTLAKKERDDQEREAEMQDHEKVRANWEAHIAQQKAEQAAREEREAAAGRIVVLREELDALKATAMEKIAEVDRLEKLLEG